MSLTYKLDKEKLEFEKSKLKFDTNKYLHEHAWKRLMWYRDELWRVTIPVWTAFGTLNAAVLAICLKSEADKLSLYRASYIIIGLLGFGILIMRTYSWYVRTMFGAVAELNKLIERDEKRIDTDNPEERYSLYKSVPELPELFYTIGMALIFVAAGITLNSINDFNSDTNFSAYLWSVPLFHKHGIPIFLIIMTVINVHLHNIIRWFDKFIKDDYKRARTAYNYEVTQTPAEKDHAQPSRELSNKGFICLALWLSLAMIILTIHVYLRVTHRL